jgi:hypothetical protein
VHLGVLTIRVDASAAEALWATLGDALHALHADLSRRPPAMGQA